MFELAQFGSDTVPPLQREPWKIFLLAVGAGLRRKEIDLLEWSSFRFEMGIIRIEATRYFRPKSEDSAGDVEVDHEIMTIFRDLQSVSASDFVVHSHKQPKVDVTYTTYRCEPHFRALLEWLRKLGIDGRSPLYTLRKEFGSYICQNFGIYAASRQLRHADHIDHDKVLR